MESKTVAEALLRDSVNEALTCRAFLSLQASLDSVYQHRLQVRDDRIVMLWIPYLDRTLYSVTLPIEHDIIAKQVGNATYSTFLLGIVIERRILRMWDVGVISVYD